MATEYLPPTLEATAEEPALFDGTTRLYMAYACPFAQRVWITRNYKGLQEKIKLVPLNLQISLLGTRKRFTLRTRCRPWNMMAKSLGTVLI
ncbi:hypothetical protein GQ457_12G009300 [Hibiscus cannabinus]